MDQQKLEIAVDKNTGDIQNLALQVTRIATIVENSERRHTDDLATIRQAIDGINKLNDRVAQTLSLEKDVSTLKDSIAEIKSDIRVARHDIGNVLTGQGVIVIHQTAIAELKAKVEALEVIRDKMTGAGSVITTGAKVFWTVFGGGIIALGTWLIIHFARG